MNISFIFEELAKDIKSAVLDHISRFGLSDSNFVNELNFEQTNKGVTIIGPDYVRYILSGRKAHSKFPPPEVIAEWCVSKGIPSDNSTVFLISRAIAYNGIPARDFMTAAEPDIDRLLDEFFKEWAGYVEEILANS